MKKRKFLLAAIVAVYTSNFAFAQWSLTGNSGTTPGTNYVGTTDAKDLVFKTNATERMRIVGNTTNPGSVCIGINTPPIPSTTLSVYKEINPFNSPYNIVSEMRMLIPFGTNFLGLRFMDFRSPSYFIRADYNSPSTSTVNNIFSVTDVGSTTIGYASSTGTMLTVAAGNINFGFTTIPSTSLSGGYKLAVSGNANIDGSLVIGTTSSFTASTPFPPPYKLYVAGGILTEKLKVSPKTTSDWSDFVFDKNYKLRSLSEVETYINENKHLPGVASAEEVVANGIDVAKMDAKLLEKIEELTLYMIEMKKVNESQQKQIEELKAQMSK